VISDAAYALDLTPGGATALDREDGPRLKAGHERPVPRVNIRAFCEDRDTAATIQLACEDRRLAQAHVTVRMGGVQAAIAFYGDAPEPDLVLIESLLDREEMLDDLDRLAEICDPSTKVIAIGHIDDVFLYRELLRRGVSDYVVAPLDARQIIDSISAIHAHAEIGPVGQVMAFVGAKGGAGSSTVCHNTAFAIAATLRSDVVIADLDLPFGTAGLNFSQEPIQGIADALSAPERLDEALLDRLLSRCSDHLSLFAAPGTLDRAYDIEPKTCATVLDAVRANVPFVAIDVPHLWTGWAKQVVLGADQVVITAVPDLANLRNAKNLVDQLGSARVNGRPPLLVLNQVGLPKRPEISVKDFAQALELEPTAVIAFDPHLFGTAANNGQMIEEASTKSSAAQQFRALAALLTDRTEAKSERVSLLAPILNRLRRRKTRT